MKMASTKPVIESRIGKSPCASIIMSWSCFIMYAQIYHSIITLLNDYRDLCYACQVQLIRRFSQHAIASNKEKNK
jgi:hypothetical protein